MRSDIILFVKWIPDVDMTAHSADVDLSKYKFFDFIDTIQVVDNFENGPTIGLYLTCDSKTIASAAD